MIRNVKQEDLPRLRELNEHTGFAFPDFPLLSGKVFVDADDVPLMFMGARPLVEMVLISSKEGDPRDRLRMIEQMAPMIESECTALGYREGMAWIPDGIWKAYSRRLKRLGWVENISRTMSYLAKGETNG